MLHPILVMNALFGIPKGQKCEFCNKATNDIDVEMLGNNSAAWSCGRCRKISNAPAHTSDDHAGRPRKKVKPDLRDTQPPSRQWTTFKFRHEMWEKMVHLHGISIDEINEHGELSEYDKGMIQQFGYYRNDITAGSFRCKDGSTIEAVDNEPVEVQLFNS